MTIYFAGSIRGGRNDQQLYLKLITHLQKHGSVFTEHVGNVDLTTQGEQQVDNLKVFDRDMKWLSQADVVVAEVSTPSLGVGYEIGVAVAQGKKILALYRKQPDRRLSAMIAGNAKITVVVYRELTDALASIDSFFSV